MSIIWEPHEYQKRAVKLLLQQAAGGLLLDPGLGKTSVALEAFRILKELGYVKRMLLVAPLRPLYGVWPAEIAKWANFNDLTYTIIHGKEKEQALDDDVDIYLINPEGVLWLADPNNDRMAQLGCDVLCVDESTKFKDSLTRRFKAFVRPYVHTFTRRWILTGTLSPNGLLDLFGQIFILDTGRSLGQYITHYRAKYFHQPNPFEKYKWEAQAGSFDKIIETISPLCLMLEAEDWLDMPELDKIEVPVWLPDEAYRQYKEVETDFLTMIEDQAVIAPNAGAMGMKCRQMANGAVYTDLKHSWVPVHDEKLRALDDLLEELNGSPALIFYEFNHDKERILKRYPDTPYLGSGISHKKTDAIIKRFNAGDYPVLLGHPASMGHGLNLQGACHHVIWFGITWNFEYYDQAIRRVYRQGQQADRVFVYHIVAQNTLDQKVIRVLKDKERDMKTLLRALKSPL